MGDHVLPQRRPGKVTADPFQHLGCSEVSTDRHIVVFSEYQPLQLAGPSWYRDDGE